MFKTFPFSSFTGWNPNPHVIRRVYGTTEVVGGIVLAACSGIAQDVSNVILLSLMLFHLFSIWRVADGLKEASNLIVLCLMLTCRFIIRIQVSYRLPSLSRIIHYFHNFVQDGSLLFTSPSHLVNM